MAGVTLSPRFNEDSNFGNGIGPSNPSMMFGSPSTYSAAATTQSSDYDKIMAQYDDLIKGSSGNRSPISFNPISARTTSYNPSSESSSAIGNLSSLAGNGGITGSEEADIRARDISPIRSIYANAQRNLDRNRVLSGGYSPNYNATSAKMAREASEQIGQITTNANANIAQSRQQGRLAIAPSFANFSNQQDQEKLTAEQANNAAQQRADELNAQLGLQTQTANRNFDQTQQGNILSAIEGKRGLYGTTPALTSTFGSQVAQAGNLAQNQEQINNTIKRDIWGRVIPVLG